MTDTPWKSKSPSWLLSHLPCSPRLSQGARKFQLRSKNLLGSGRSPSAPPASSPPGKNIIAGKQANAKHWDLPGGRSATPPAKNDNTAPVTTWRKPHLPPLQLHELQPLQLRLPLHLRHAQPELRSATMKGAQASSSIHITAWRPNTSKEETLAQIPPAPRFSNSFSKSSRDRFFAACNTRHGTPQLSRYASMEGPRVDGDHKLMADV